MDGFTLTLDAFSRHGSGLHRPECVLSTVHGDLYVSDERGGVTHIAPDGACRLFAGSTVDGVPAAANGFAMLRDGSFLVAPLAGGGVFRLQRNGQASPYLREADGMPLHCPNFVLLDHHERLWICCLTNQDRRTLTQYHRSRRDGMIVMVDRQGARIVAEGIGFPNEVRLDPTERWLYTNETLAARLLRYPIRNDGSLGPCEVVANFDDSNVFDGFTLDSQGGAWITTLVSNRLWYVSPRGDVRLLIEDSHPEQIEALIGMQRSTGVQRAILYEERGLSLRNISSVCFGGPDLRTAFMGSLMGDNILSFRAPVAGMAPAHWEFGPFGDGA